jgi:hypothetical protein
MRGGRARTGRPIAHAPHPGPLPADATGFTQVRDGIGGVASLYATLWSGGPAIGLGAKAATFRKDDHGGTAPNPALIGRIASSLLCACYLPVTS